MHGVKQRIQSAGGKRTSPSSVQQGRGAALAQGNPLQAWQRGVGNQAVGHVLQADATAGPHPAQLLQRMCAACASGTETCAECREEQPLQRRATAAAAAAADPPAAPAGLRSTLARGSGRPLAPPVRRFMESRFRHDFGGVRVHTGPTAQRAAAAVSATAFTIGRDIWFGRGQYRPDSPGGLHLLAHELSHTIQQRNAPRLQADLVVGRVDDPAEAAADRAADAVLGNRPPPTLPAVGSLLQRDIRSVRSGGRPNVVLIDTDEARFRVTRRVVRHERQVVDTWDWRPPRAGFRADPDDVWLQIDWCRGTRGRVRIGANVPDAFRTAARRVAEAVLAGDDPASVLGDAELTPFADFVIAQSGGVQVTGRIRVTVSPEGFVRLEGGVGVTSGPFTGRLEAEGGEGEPGRIMVELEVTPGRRPESFVCPRDRRRSVVVRPIIDYLCERLHHIPAGTRTRTREVERPDVRTRYIYFDYAEHSIDETRSAAELADLRRDLEAGYRVTGIEGFTSPEGPIEPGRRFRGNRQLAQDRADEAKRKVQVVCAGLAEAPSCFEGGEAAVTPVGREELHTLIEEVGGEPREVEGERLLEHAEEQFRTDPREARHRPTEPEEEPSRPLTTSAREQRVYPWLRRAVVTLSKLVTVEERFEEPTPARDEWRSVACPTEILAEAKRHFHRWGTPLPPAPRRR